LSYYFICVIAFHYALLVVYIPRLYGCSMLTGYTRLVDVVYKYCSFTKERQ